jgi:hypothetical protein
LTRNIDERASTTDTSLENLGVYLISHRRNNMKKDIYAEAYKRIAAMDELPTMRFSKRWPGCCWIPCNGGKHKAKSNKKKKTTKGKKYAS